MSKLKKAAYGITVESFHVIPQMIVGKKGAKPEPERYLALLGPVAMTVVLKMLFLISCLAREMENWAYMKWGRSK